MNAKSKSSIDVRPNRSSSISRVALMIFFILMVTVNFSRIARAQQKSSEPSPDALEAEQRLSDLGYWTGPVDGVFDVGSRHALIAFQKVERRSLTGKLTSDELKAIRAAK